MFFIVKLTEEQQQVIEHPDHHHGKVLAVAGSGKTTTMAHRILHLMRERGVPRHQIQVLMFNRLARHQFIESLAQLGLKEGQQPPVNTFNSYANQLLDSQSFKHWMGVAEDRAHLCLLQAKTKVCKYLKVSEDKIDIDEAKKAIGLWKGALVPPSRAGYKGKHTEVYVAIYKAYENDRQQNNAITYDDQVPMAVQKLQISPDLLQGKANAVRYLIVDEYQDVNLGQQKLIELLVSGGADIMVVGDDDQTIYEWRGARSDYILGEYENTFTNKPHLTYRLTRSFRFGYCIAQASANVISHNAHRLPKPLISNKPGSQCDVTLVSDSNEPGGYANRRLSEEIIGLITQKKANPSDIRILGRTYSQLNGLQTEFLFRKIPFDVVGNKSFLQAGECQALLNYVRIAATLDCMLTQETQEQFKVIANKPSRFLNSREIDSMLSHGRRQGWTLNQLLQTTLEDDYTKFIRGSARENLADLTWVLRSIQKKLMPKETSWAGPLLKWIDHEIGFRQHYENYYGPGEASLMRIKTIESFIGYACREEMNWQKFITHVDNTDTTQGRPEKEWIKMMTIHSTKGLEFDYIVIPNCTEGYLPVILDNNDPTFDNREPRRTPQAAEWVENERRLFYVGATRAKKELFIGTTTLTFKAQEKNERTANEKPSRFLEEMELDQTRTVAQELRLAATGNSEHKLIETCQHFSAFHHIVRRIKEDYVHLLPRKLRPALARVNLSAAERPFGYKQNYVSPADHRKPSERLGDNNKEDDDIYWSHIDVRRPRKSLLHNNVDSDEGDIPF